MISAVFFLQVLCSVPTKKLEGVVLRLYQCLKKDGELIVYEHVRSDDRVSAFVQSESRKENRTSEGQYDIIRDADMCVACFRCV